MTRIRIVEEPPFTGYPGPPYAKEALKGLILSVDESAPPKEESYAVKKEEIIRALNEKNDKIAAGWWLERFWPPHGSPWIYFPKKCCEKVF